MRVFVTGGTGFIGQVLVRALVKEAAVNLLVRPTSCREGIEHPDIHFVEGDLSDLNSLRRGMRECQRVFHLGALVRKWVPDPTVFDRINLLGTRNVFQVALEQRVEKVVYTSSIVAIGPSHGVPADEKTSRQTPYFTPYERTKALAEVEFLDAVGNGLPAVVVLPSLVYGPSERCDRFSFNRFLYCLLRGIWVPIPGNGERKCNVVYVDDVVQGHLLAMEHGKVGERYILSGENTSPNLLGSSIADVLGRSSTIRHVPFLFAAVGASIAEQAARWFGIEPPIDRGSLKAFRYDWTYTSSKAEREIGYQYRSFEQGLQKTLDWLVQEGRIKRPPLRYN